MDGSTMTFAVVAGLIIPTVISYLKSTGWSKQAKQALSFAASVVVGIGISVIDYGVSFDDWSSIVANVGIVFTTAQLFYRQYFADTELNERLEKAGIGS
jgi:hypothetical protein